MVEASWDNSGAPRTPKGMPLWAKIGLGCGVAFLLFLGTCAGGLYFAYRKGASVADRAWADMRADAQRLMTDEGARELYRANPGLVDNYPTEEEFLKTSEEWRSKLGRIPAQRPDIRTLLHEKRSLRIHTGRREGHETVRIHYRLESGALLVMETEDGGLTDIRIE